MITQQLQTFAKKHILVLQCMKRLCIHIGMCYFSLMHTTTKDYTNLYNFHIQLIVLTWKWKSMFHLVAHTYTCFNLVGQKFMWNILATVFKIEGNLNVFKDFYMSIDRIYSKYASWNDACNKTCIEHALVKTSQIQLIQHQLGNSTDVKIIQIQWRKLWWI